MPHNHVGYLVADLQDRVERVHSALEDHRDIAPAEGFQPGLVHFKDIFAIEQNIAAGNYGGRVEHAHYRVGDGRFAAARLARQPEHLAGRNRERNAIHRPHGAAAVSYST